MNIDEVRVELIKRYKYLYVNSEIILAPYMYEQTIDDLKKFGRGTKKVLKKFSKEWNESLIYSG